jgi:hypothetical protein
MVMRVVPVLLMSMLVPCSAFAQVETPRGFPREVAWITLSGASEQDAYCDSLATWRAQQSAGVDPDLVTIVYPSTLPQRPAPPAGAEPATLYRSAKALADLLHPDALTTKRIQLHGGSPDLVVIHLDAQGTPDGSWQWGKEKLSLDVMQSMLTNVHAMFPAPVLIIADRCDPAAVRGITDRLKGQPRREDEYFILASLPKQYDHAQRFVDAWEHKTVLWPVSGQSREGFYKSVAGVFETEKVYGRLATNLLVGWLGAATDVAGEGLDAGDLCGFLQKIESIRQQPPINASPRTKADIICDATSSGQTARFAFTERAPTIGFDKARPDLYPPDGEPYNEVVAEFEGAFREQAKTFGYTLPDKSVSECLLKKSCKTDWICRVDWDNGYAAYCERRGREAQEKIQEPPTLAFDDLKARLLRVASQVLPSPRTTSHRGDTPRAETPITYGVLLDRSGSMNTSDPGGLRRRHFFDVIVAPAIEQGTINRLLLVSYAGDVKHQDCFDRGHGDTVDQARRCFMKETTSEGKTNLLGAAKDMAPRLGPKDVVWLLTDGADSVRIPECPPDKGTGCIAETPDQTDCPGPQYRACKLEKISEAGSSLAAAGRQIYALFFHSPVGQENALRQLAKIRGNAGEGRLLPLDNGPGRDGQDAYLTVLGRVMVGQSIAALLLPRQHACLTQGAALHCINNYDVDVSQNSSELVVHWDDKIVENQRIYLPTPKITLAPGSPIAVDPKGVTVQMEVRDGVTRLKWSPPAGKRLEASPWKVELQYDVTGVAK